MHLIVGEPVPQVLEEIVTLVACRRQATAHIEQIVDVPVPRIWEQSVEVIKVIPEEWMSKRIVQQIVDVPVPQIPKQIVEVVLVILQEQCQRVLFFFCQHVERGCGLHAKSVCCPTVHLHTRVLAYFDSVWEGGCGRHVPHVLPHSPPPHARVDSECKRWNLERVVLDLFSHFTLGKVQVRWLCVSCRGSRTRPTHIALHEHHVMQFPFLPERRGRGAPMAPVPLKRKRDTSNEPKTDPMKRAYMLVPDEAKLSFSPDADAEARDSEPEAHVMEPLADDHSSDSDDTPTGIEEVLVVTLFLNSLTMCAAVSEEAASDILVGRSHATGAGLVRDPRAANWSTQPQPGYELGVTSPRAHVRVNRVVVVCCCTFFASSIACTQNRVK